MDFSHISPKVLIPAVTQVVAGLLLWAITGDQEWLIAVATGVLGGGIGAGAPPAPGVKQAEVAALAAQRKRSR